MTQETAKERKICGFQPSGKNQDIPKPPKFKIDKEFLNRETNDSPVTAYLKASKVQEQLSTAKYFFKNILDVNPNLHEGNSVRHLQNCVRVMKTSAEKALKALEGGEDV